MIQLIYTSTVRVPFSGAEMSRLLLKARAENEVAEITGMLLYRRDSIMQLIEGEEQAVDALFSRILLDPRHAGIQILRRATIQNRTFPGWSMGFVHFDKGRTYEPNGLAEFFEKKGRPAPSAGEAALKLLSDFRFGWLRSVDRGYSPVVAR